MKKQTNLEWKQKMQIMLAMATGLAALVLTFYVALSIHTIVMKALTSHINIPIVITALNIVTIHIELGFTLLTTFSIIIATLAASAEIIKSQTKRINVHYHKIESLDQEKEIERTINKNKESKKEVYYNNSVYTIDDLRQEKEKLESSLIEQVDTKQKQKVLD